MVQMTSPAERNVFGRVKDGTQKRITMILWNRTTSMAIFAASGPRLYILISSGIPKNIRTEITAVMPMAIFISFFV